MKSVSKRPGTRMTRVAAAVASIGLALSFSLAAASPAAASTVVTKTFTTADVTNGFTTWTVPTGIKTLTISAVGANGAPSPSIANGGMGTSGGLGAVVDVKVTVVPGSVLTIAAGSVTGPSGPGVPGGGGSAAWRHVGRWRMERCAAG